MSGGQVVILGGCGGIGRAVVAAAGATGYAPVVFDLPASIEAHPPDGPAMAVDATDAAALARAADGLAHGIAGAVMLQGFVTEAEEVTETSPAHWDEVLRGNLGSAQIAAACLAPRIRDGGALVFCGSGLGHRPRPGYGAYAVAKAGVAALTRQLALELAPRLRVNCVAPAAVDTAFLRGGTGRSDEAQPARLDLDVYAQAVPLGRIATAEDVAGPVLFLLSDAARYITGQVLHVNGGTHMP